MARTVFVPLEEASGAVLVERRGEWRVREHDEVESGDVRFELRESSGELEPVLLLQGELEIAGGPEGSVVELRDAKRGKSFAYRYEGRDGDDGSAAWTRLAAQSNCESGPCANGSCTITCNPPLLCVAGCVNGDPYCRCASAVPPQPRPLPPIPFSDCGPGMAKRGTAKRGAR